MKVSSSSLVVTMLEVAKLAGVHQATVSRVLTRPDVVKPQTRQRVLAVIEETGYVPHAGARQLAGGRTGLVAVLIPDLANPFFAELLKLMQRSMGEHGHRMLVADTELSSTAELDLVRSLVPNVDAVVVCSPVSTTSRLVQAAGETPLVFVNRATRSVASLVIDQRAIVRVGVEHLRDLGHRSIGAILGPDAYWSSAQRSKALAGYAELVTFPAVSPTFDGGVAALDEVLASGVTGVLAFNDLVALGLLSEASSRGIAVPDRLSVVGSDDVALASMATPPLTTVKVSLVNLASRVVGLVENALAGSQGCESLIEPVSLQVRNSTTRLSEGSR